MEEDSNLRHNLSSVKAYAFRVLDFSSDMPTGLVPAEAPTTPDRPSDKGVLLVLEQFPEVKERIPSNCSEAESTINSKDIK
jgi:hypothetical protein